MQIVFNIDQKSAIRHGKNAPRPVEPVDIDPSTLSEEQRALLSSLTRPAERGELANATGVRTYDGVNVQLHLLEPTAKEVQAQLQAALQEIASKRAEREQKINEEKDNYRAALQAIENGSWFEAGTFPPKVRKGIVRYDRLYAPNYSANDDEARELYDRAVKMERKAWNEAVRQADATLQPDDRDLRLRLLQAVSSADQQELCPNARRFADEEREQREREKQAEQERRKAELRRLIDEEGLPDQLERFDAGVLPSEELKLLVKRVLFEAFDQFTRYLRLKADDIDHDEDCFDHEPKFTSSPAESLTAAQWNTLQEIRAAAPKDAVVEARRSMAWCGNCSEDNERYWARVTRSFAGEDYQIALAL